MRLRYVMPLLLVSFAAWAFSPEELLSARQIIKAADSTSLSTSHSKPQQRKKPKPRLSPSASSAAMKIRCSRNGEVVSCSLEHPADT